MQKELYGQEVTLTQEDTAHIFSMEEKSRIAYYLGNIAKTPARLCSDTPAFHPNHKPYHLMVADHRTIQAAARTLRLDEGYTLPLLHLYTLLPDSYKTKPFLYRPGDFFGKSRFDGLLAKTRRCDDRAVTLLKLKQSRHWKPFYSNSMADIPYLQKKNIAIWRGATTGNKKKTGRRADLVRTFSTGHANFDVGFSKISKSQSPRDHPPVKDSKAIDELLTYKFLICLEGNDIASGLKWMLRSNSVVMMPRPTICSWLMEDRLEPFVHYIPLANDFSDAQSRVNWAIQHESECMRISANASKYMSQFLDPRRETLLELEVFRRYLDQISFDLFSST